MKEIMIKNIKFLINKRCDGKQIRFAKRIDVREHTVTSWLQGRTYPRAEIIVKICKTFNVSADWLLGLERK